MTMMLRGERMPSLGRQTVLSQDRNEVKWSLRIDNVDNSNISFHRSNQEC